MHKVVEITGQVGVAQHLDSDTNHQGFASTNDIHKEQRGSNTAHELRQSIEAGGIDLDACRLDPDDAKDLGQIVGDGVCARELREDVSEHGELHAPQIRANAEGLTEQRQIGLVPKFSLLVGDLGAHLVPLISQIRVVRVESAERNQRRERLVVPSAEAEPSG